MIKTKTNQKDMKISNLKDFKTLKLNMPLLTSLDSQLNYKIK
jgi:hypothetical protein